MPEHVSETHFNLGDVTHLDNIPYIKGESIVWLDSKDSVTKRYRMDDGVLVLQYWDGSSWKDV